MPLTGARLSSSKFSWKNKQGILFFGVASRRRSAGVERIGEATRLLAKSLACRRVELVSRDA